MADQKVTELTAATSVSADDVLYVVDAPGTLPTSKKITVDNFQKSLTTLGGAAGVVSGGNVTVPAASYLYIGDSGTNGSWRFYISGADLVIEKREAGTWNEKSRFTA